MRGEDRLSGSLFSYVDLEAGVPARHPLRLIREIVSDVLGSLSADFASAYSDIGRPSIAPERLIRALLLQAFYSVRSEHQLMGRSSSTCCSVGSAGSAWTTRCGTRARSAIIGTVCWKPTFQRWS